MAPSVVADVSGTQPVLSEDCMMVGVRLSNMSFKVKDDEASAELIKQHDAEPNAFLVTKDRFYKEDVSPVVSANGAIRAWVKKWTFKLPQATDDNGQSKAPRLIVVSSMPTAMEELGVLLDDRDEAINVLLNNYETFIEKGQKLMGGFQVFSQCCIVRYPHCRQHRRREVHRRDATRGARKAGRNG